ncbi:MAG: sugar phosphate isomerase/epimerase family protein [Cytophagales bacterium]
MKNYSRRKFLFSSLAISSLPTFQSEILGAIFQKKKVDLALQIYSFAPLLFQNKLDILKFPEMIREKYKINGAEYWSIAFMGKENDTNFIKDLKKRSLDQNVENLIILVDNIDINTMENGPSLASSEKNERDKSIDFHKKWIDIASEIGCHSIRVNLRSDESNTDKILDNSSKSISKLIDHSSSQGVSIVVENHGGITGDADWLVSLMTNINNDYVGTLPDFGSYNFCVKRGELNFEGLTGECENQYDKYKGVKKLLPFAKGISAKSHEFNSMGEETSTDFSRMMDIISSSSYKGYITIEYEGAMMKMFGGKGDYLDPHDGVQATKSLINKYI